MPEVELIATGGVDAGNAGDFLAAGAAAVGIGSAITRADPEARRALVARLSGPL
jgi:2-keto-3-deoxy-6-phosphogluconate aldolase